jgi:hypothetical protein
MPARATSANGQQQQCAIEICRGGEVLEASIRAPSRTNWLHLHQQGRSNGGYLTVGSSRMVARPELLPPTPPPWRLGQVCGGSPCRLSQYMPIRYRRRGGPLPVSPTHPPPGENGPSKRCALTKSFPQRRLHNSGLCPFSPGPHPCSKMAINQSRSHRFNAEMLPVRANATSSAYINLSGISKI